MVYTHGDSSEYELDSLFSVGMLEDIKIEFMNIPRSAVPRSTGRVKYLLNGDGIITLDIKNKPREKLKNALHGAILFSSESYDYIFGYSSFGYSSFIDMEKGSKIDDLVERIISEPSSLIVDEMGYMIEDAELEYMKRFSGKFNSH